MKAKTGVIKSHNSCRIRSFALRYWTAIVFPTLFFADQTSKWFFSRLGDKSYIFKPLGFGIRYLTHRKYHIWGLLSVSDEHGLISVPIALAVLAFWWFLFRFMLLKFHGGNRSVNLGFVLICGGLVSNISDKLFLKCARDFLVVPHFGVTNFADLFYYCGAFLLLLVFLRRRNALKTRDLMLFFRDEVARSKPWLVKSGRK